MRMSTRPAQIFGLDAGTLKPGAKADITLIDLDEPWLVSKDMLLSRSKNTPFEDARFTGRAVRTYVAGQLCALSLSNRVTGGDNDVRILSTWQITLPLALAAAVFGYLLGSIPFGLILTRAWPGSATSASIGSGNIGATNVLRTGNKKLAAATLAARCAEGYGRGLAHRLTSSAIEAALIAGFFAFLGHLFPVWLGFKGGKGVATYIGVLLGVAPIMVLLFAAVWLAVAFITRYSSLSALVAMLVIPVVLWILGAREGCGRHGDHDAHLLDQAQGEYLAAVERDGKQDRGKGIGWTSQQRRTKRELR